MIVILITIAILLFGIFCAFYRNHPPPVHLAGYLFGPVLIFRWGRPRH